MGTPVVMDPHALWAAKGLAQAVRNRTACVEAARDIANRLFVDFDQVVLIEHNEMTDIGTLRLEPSRLVFAGGSCTRVVPFNTVVLMGTQPLIGEPERNACSVNSSEYLATMLFLAERPLEYHISAWYSRWLEMAPFTESDPPDTVQAITPT